MPELIEKLARVELQPDKMLAQLVLLPGATSADLQPMMIEYMLDQKGLPRTGERAKAVAFAVKRYFDNGGRELRVDVARGVPCEDGEDARLEVVQVAADNGQSRGEVWEGDDDSIDQHARSKHTSVKGGSVIARLHPATAGKDGFDVFGSVVRARQGRTITPRIDDSVVMRSDGTVIALRSGLATVSEERIGVQSVLHVEGVVDYATGNIDFPGDVVIDKGVRDCFVVRAAGDITVHDLVDAATIEAGGNVVLDTGMAAREQGKLSVGKDLRTKYLSDVRGSIGRDADVLVELANCTLTIGRDLKGAKCTLVRGVVRVGGRCELCDLGSDANVPTDLVLGELDGFDELGRRTTSLLSEVEACQAAAQSRIKDLRGGGRSKDARQAEVLTQLQFELEQMRSTMHKLRGAAVKLVRTAHAHSTVSLRVAGTIYPKVTLVIGGRTATFTKPLRGPVLIDLNEDGEPRVTDLTTRRVQALSAVSHVSGPNDPSSMALLRERFAGELLIGDGSALVA